MFKQLVGCGLLCVAASSSWAAGSQSVQIPVQLTISAQCTQISSSPIATVTQSSAVHSLRRSPGVAKTLALAAAPATAAKARTSLPLPQPALQQHLPAVVF